ncbi:MAG: hypothetical protein ACREJ0_15350 [Geminicoccaceae bacterium]
MLALGSVGVGVGVLLAGLLALLFRHPRAPRWAQAEVVVFLSMVPVTAMIGFGLGYVLYGGIGLLYGQGHVGELAVPALVPVVVALIWHALGIRERLRAYAEAAAGEPSGAAPMTVVSLAGPTDQPPQSPSPDNPPRRPTRKAA